MRQLTPVGGNHVGCRGQAGGAAELGHHLPARKAVFGAARVFGIRHHAFHAPHQANGVFQQPTAVRVERDPGLREALVQGGHGMDGGAQVKGLQAATAAVAVGEFCLHVLQNAK